MHTCDCDDDGDGEYNSFDEYHCYSNNSNVRLNVKVGHYCDNDTVDLCIDGLCSLKILIVEYFEFYHRLK